MQLAIHPSGGVDVAGLAEVGEHLDSFVSEVFSPLARKDRVATAWDMCVG
ncbi:hypothetical protein [Nocardia sp. NBC_00403]